MKRSEQRHAFEEQLRHEVLSRNTGIHERMLIIGSKPINAGDGATFALVVMPHGYHDVNRVMRYKPGARWVVHVTDVQLWTAEAKQLMLTLVADEVETYLTKGTIKDENATSDDVDLGPASLCRAADRTIN